MVKTVSMPGLLAISTCNIKTRVASSECGAVATALDQPRTSFVPTSPIIAMTQASGLQKAPQNRRTPKMLRDFHVGQLAEIIIAPSGE